MVRDCLAYRGQPVQGDARAAIAGEQRGGNLDLARMPNGSRSGPHADGAHAIIIMPRGVERDKDGSSTLGY
jgi:hypothetical protein